MAYLCTRRVRAPFTHGCANGGQQLHGLFLKDGEEVGVDGVNGFNLVIIQRHSMHGGLLLHGWNHRLWLRCSRQLLCNRGRSGLLHVCLHLCRCLAEQCAIEYVLQLRMQLLGGSRQHASSKLVQHGANFLCSTHKHLHLLGHAMRLWCHMLQSMLELARQARQCSKAYSGGTASQRMRPGIDHVWLRFVQFGLPACQGRQQSGRPLFSLAQIDIEQRQRDGNITNLLDFHSRCSGCFLLLLCSRHCFSLRPHFLLGWHGLHGFSSVRLQL